MKNTIFYKYFLRFVEELYDFEQQIIDTIPTLIKASYNNELKECLTKHLKETREHVIRLNRIFKILGEEAKRKNCKGIEGILEEGRKVIQEPGITHAVKDCFIVITAQQIEHFEIASYGSAIALVEHIKSAVSSKSEFKEIYDLLKETIKEEGNADKTLTKVAQGKLFTKGINEELESEIHLAR